MQLTSGFSPPAFDDSLAVPQWIQFNGHNSPNHPIFVYSPLVQDAAIQIITWSEFAQAINIAANMVRAQIDKNLITRARPPVIAILANIDTITYQTLLWGIITAGGTAFPISARNSPDAVLDLLRKTGSELMFDGLDIDASNVKPGSSVLECDAVRLQIPSFSELYSCKREPAGYTNIWPQTNHDQALNTTAIILHSSGTTSLPSPIHVSHQLLLQWSRNSNIEGEDMSKHRIAVHGLPVSHGMGYFVIPWAARTGMSISVFPPCDPPITPSHANLLKDAIACRSTVIFSVPIFIEIWSRNTEDIECLKKFNGVIFGGGPIEKTVGNILSQNGIILAGLYGTTEAGPVGQINLEPYENEGWEWLTINPQCDARFIPHEGISSVFELVFVECSTHTPASFNFTVDGKRAFATNDLVWKHPKNPRKFRVYGRKDDQIVLSTGEKANPGPIETIICRSPIVEAAIVIGHGKTHIGVIIQPAKGHEVPPNNIVALEDYRKSIWPSVEQANALSPSHSKIFKEMILVTHPSKPMELTAKRTPRRSVILATYRNEIDVAYIAVSISKHRLCVPSTWTSHQILLFVRSVVNAVMGRSTPLSDYDDIFEYGGDSIKATYIRNTIIQTILQENQTVSSLITQDVVYSNPTITALTDKISSLMDSTISCPDGQQLPKIDRIQGIIKDLSSTFSTHQPSPRLASNQSQTVVLLTGTTGALGSQLLANLASSLDVTHVYALNRRSDTGISLRTRQIDALTRRNLPPTVIDWDKVTLLEGNGTLEDLGLERRIFEEIRDNVNLIIHTAWRVNFNLSLNSYIPMLQGVRKLIDLALQSPLPAPPRFIFASSVGVYRNWKVHEPPKEKPIEDINVIVGIGYSESKWIAERILEEAAARTSLRPIIVRIGQMTGNSSGAWNSTDWLPAVLRSGQLIGALPSRNDSIAWISIEVAARAMFEFRTSHSQYLHLAHPNPVPWMRVFSVFSEKLNLPLIPWSEWVKRLDNGRIEDSPALHLLSFFQQAAPVAIENNEALGIPLVDLTGAMLASSALSDPYLPQISVRDAEAWVTHWRDIGFLTG